MSSRNLPVSVAFPPPVLVSECTWLSHGCWDPSSGSLSLFFFFFNWEGSVCFRLVAAVEKYINKHTINSPQKPDKHASGALEKWIAVLFKGGPLGKDVSCRVCVWPGVSMGGGCVSQYVTGCGLCGLVCPWWWLVWPHVHEDCWCVPVCLRCDWCVPVCPWVAGVPMGAAGLFPHSHFPSQG